MTDRSRAARKAWATRRKNGWVHPASRPKKAKKAAPVLTSGQKAAQTRRNNARQAMLRARALKAWKTRRANAA